MRRTEHKYGILPLGMSLVVWFPLVQHNELVITVEIFAGNERSQQGRELANSVGTRIAAQRCQAFIERFRRLWRERCPESSYGTMRARSSPLEPHPCLPSCC